MTQTLEPSKVSGAPAKHRRTPSKSTVHTRRRLIPYALILPAVSLSGARAETDADGIYAPADALVSASAEGSLTWVLGGGEAKLEPYAGCTLSEAELRALCPLRLMEIE